MYDGGWKCQLVTKSSMIRKMWEKRRGIETQVERQSIRDAAERTLGTKKLELEV